MIAFTDGKFPAKALNANINDGASQYFRVQLEARLNATEKESSLRRTNLFGNGAFEKLAAIYLSIRNVFSLVPDRTHKAPEI